MEYQWLTLLQRLDHILMEVGHSLALFSERQV